MKSFIENIIKKVHFITHRYLRFLISGIFLAIVVFSAMFPGVIATYSPTEMHPINRLQGPSKKYILGTDGFGRDLYSRIVHGARISVVVSSFSVFIALIGGLILGLPGGYFERFGDIFIMRLVDITLCFPPIIMGVMILAFLESGYVSIILVIGFLYTPRMTRIIHSATIEVKEEEYITAQKAQGANAFYILRKGVLPNIIAPIIVQATLMLATAMLLEAGFSFLGLGIPPPEPSWGSMVSRGRTYLSMAPHVCLFPAIALALTILSVNATGDALRDELDPRLRNIVR